MKFSFEMPVQTKNESNQRGLVPFAKVRRAKIARNAVGYLFPKAKLRPVVRVTLTRIAPRELDTDGLASALKSVRDGVASAMRIDDATRLVQWAYEQEKPNGPGHQGVRITVESLSVQSEEAKAKIEAALKAISG